MKYQPCPGNAPGPFYVVSAHCLGCHAAYDEATDLMDFAGHPKYHHCRFHRQPRTEAEIDLAIRAIEVCCTHAVRYAGTDKVILDRLSDQNQPEWCDALPDSDGLNLPANLS